MEAGEMLAKVSLAVLVFTVDHVRNSR